MSERSIKEWYKFAYRLLVNDQWHVIAERVENGDETYRWVKEQLILALRVIQQEGSQWLRSSAFSFQQRLESFKSSTISEEIYLEVQAALADHIPGGKFVLKDESLSVPRRLLGAKLALVRGVLVNLDEPEKAGREICDVFKNIIFIKAVVDAIYEKTDAKMAYEVKVMYDISKEYAQTNKIPIDDLIELEFDPANLPSEKPPIFNPPETWVFGDIGEEEGKFYRPERVHIDQEGNYLVMDRDRIQLFSPLGKFMKVILQKGSGKVNEMGDFCLNKNGNIVVADTDDQNIARIQIFDYDGNQLMVINIEKDNPDHFPYISSIFIDEYDNIICADRGLSCVRVFSPDGKVKARFGKWGRPDGCFGALSCVAANNDKIYAFALGLDGPDKRTQVFDYNGTFIQSIWHGYSYKQVVFHTDGQIYAVRDHYIDRLGLEGNHEVVAGRESSFGSSLDDFYDLSSMSFLPDGRVAVSDSSNHRIKVFKL